MQNQEVNDEIHEDSKKIDMLLEEVRELREIINQKKE